MGIIAIVGKDGVSRRLYSEEGEKLLKQMGPAELRRASFVEPTDCLQPATIAWIRQHIPESQPIPAGWWADLQPSGGPVLGPLETKQLALDAECAWLHERGLPIPKPVYVNKE